MNEFDRQNKHLGAGASSSSAGAAESTTPTHHRKRRLSSNNDDSADDDYDYEEYMLEDLEEVDCEGTYVRFFCCKTKITAASDA